MNKRFVVIDLETTGHSPKQGDKIIQFAAVVIENGLIVDRFSSFLNPELPIPPFIEQLTHINDDMVKDAPLFKEIAPKVLQLMKDSYFVAHNVAFDLSFLQDELHNHGYDTLYNSPIDTVELARILLPTIDGYKLNQLADCLSITHDNPHQADSDAEVTAQILLMLIEKMKQLPLTTLKQLYSLSLHLKSEIGELIEDVIEEKQQLIEENSDFVFLHGLAIRKMENEKEETKEIPFTYKEFSKQKHEHFNSILTNFEDRKEQWQMMDLVDEAFSSHEHALIEAGTGTGKTLAYLIPAAMYAVKERKQVVVSTHTISLQQQLIEKDLTLASKLLSFPLSAVVLKGREHYISVRKFLHLLKERENNYDAILTKAKILVWLTETTTGDIDEINLPSGGKLFWDRINEANPSQVDVRNPWIHHSYYERARARAKRAHIIVTNHRLLLMDVLSNQSLLPHYDHVIIDEAHHFEEIASEELGVHLDYFSIHTLLTRIGSLQTKGLLIDVHKVMSKYHHTKPLERINDMIGQLHAECNDLFRLIHSYVLKKGNKPAVDIGRLSYRYHTKAEQGSHWSAILELASRVRFLLRDFLHMIRSEQAGIEANLGSFKKEEQAIFHEFFTVCHMFEDVDHRLYKLLFESEENEVMWFEIEPKGAANATFLYSQPVSVADQLADLFFAKKQTVILTSATLTVHHSFDYVINELGLYDFQPLQLSVQSPFSYEKQAKVFIPSDFPAINSVSVEEYSALLAESILDVASITNGKMLVLFTSYDMLKQTYSYMKELNDLEEFVLLGQGVTTRNRNRLIKDFTQFDKAILLGTNSFWEGIDIPGEKLSALMIVRLPFSPPEQPFVAAKVERLKNNGQNAFIDYSLPQAIIKFKQGFGRLIRSRKDRGVVYIFDNRVTSTTYGKYFLMSLPQVDIKEKAFHETLDDLQTWWKDISIDH
ncbi:ATP-dependent DNA helicase DinG [Metabacillus iocasae]|uniref:3'-5' exonuclease DinG n=1 Tax=Priestia iocasae TaxID=2291674 RepID=A0ABS2QV06_9BACI|nr:ATP-dependent DNA helicase DinG [Metabacillus iocasae]MBM7703329.1 ATP-dependent DNA helicase DinG [Metabacillus iocasae]